MIVALETVMRRYWKRLIYFITATLACGSIFFVTEFQTPYVVSPLSLWWFHAFLVNVPLLVRMFHMRPIHYEDLYIDDVPGANQPFQHYFLQLLTILQAIVAAALLEYLVYRLNHDNFSLVEIAALIGGLASLYSRIQTLGGNVLLTILSRQKRAQVKILQEINNAQL